MDVIILIVGVGITWLITHLYNKSNNKNQDIFYNKFSKKVRDIFLADKRDLLSISDINAILRHRILDKNIKGPFKYKLCPSCGSDKITNKIDYVVDGDHDNLYGVPYHIVNCDDCGWEKSQLEADSEAFEYK